MCRKVLIVMLAVVAVACVSFGQGKTDLSGTWKLNVAKSDFGPVPGPTAQTDVIEQIGQTITISVTAETEEGKLQYPVTLVTDGKEVMIPPDAPGAHPNPEVTLQSLSASWDGATLTVNQKLTYGTDPVTGVSHYALSPDGKVLTISSDYQSGMGDASRTFVFEKQDSSMGAASVAMSAPAAGSAPAAPTGMSVSTSGDGSAASMSAKPNLSGTWLLDTSKSEFGQMPAPESRTDTIDDKEPSIKITVNQTGGPMGATTFTLDLVTDGKQVATSTVFGNEAKSTAHWEGSSLVVNTQLTVQGNAATIVGKYNLSADGNTLTVMRDISGPMGQAQQKLVFMKK